GTFEEGVHPPDTELYVRWMQFGMLCSQTRFHGILPREPWNFGETAVEVSRIFGALRRRPPPYFKACAREAAEHGWPILRPVALEFPEDLGARHVDPEDPL